MYKKYQVFVSSTYCDLLEERQEVMQALLELDCIPVGMELFPAANDDQWTLIKELIKDCDYYVLIVGGRYGSIGPTGKSYTQMEYEYAVSEKIPIISFINNNPGKIIAEKTEYTEQGKEKLKDFIELVKGRMCGFWNNPSDLGSKVSRSLIKLIRANPRIGWVKADVITSDEANKEISILRKENDELKAKLEKVRISAPIGSENLKQGDDKLELNYSYDDEYEDNSGIMSLSWNEIFYSIAPLMVDEISEKSLKYSLNHVLKRRLEKEGKIDINSIYINDEDFQTIKVQLIALGLILKSEKKRSLRESGVYWTLTPYGETTMMKLRALSK